MDVQGYCLPSGQHTLNSQDSSFFFLMTPPPPRSTLFPYTTLFRSLLAKFVLKRILTDENMVPALPLVANSRHDWLVTRPGVRELIRRIQATWRRRVENGMDLFGVEDRKSTRLNSSHVAISYAVFCL